MVPPETVLYESLVTVATKSTKKHYVLAAVRVKEVTVTVCPDVIEPFT